MLLPHSGRGLQSEKLKYAAKHRFLLPKMVYLKSHVDYTKEIWEMIAASLTFSDGISLSQCAQDHRGRAGAGARRQARGRLLVHEGGARPSVRRRAGESGQPGGSWQVAQRR